MGMDLHTEAVITGSLNQWDLYLKTMGQVYKLTLAQHLLQALKLINRRLIILKATQGVEKLRVVQDKAKFNKMFNHSSPLLIHNLSMGIGTIQMIYHRF
jgi:hypothetical protein